MSFFSDDHVLQNGERGSAGPSVGVWDMAYQGFAQQYHVDSSLALPSELALRWDDSLTALRASGQNFEAPSYLGVYTRFAGALRGETYEARSKSGELNRELDAEFENMQRANEAIRQLNNPNIRTFEQILEGASSMQHETEERTASMSERTGAAGTVASMLGGMVGSFTTRDPINLITAPIGFGRTIAARIATDIAVNAGVAALTDVAEVNPNRALVGLPEHNPYYDAAIAGVAAGVFRGALIEPLGAAFRHLGSAGEGINFDFRDAQMQQMFTTAEHSPSARAASSILGDTQVFEQSNPYGTGMVAGYRWQADLEGTARALNGEDNVTTTLPPVPSDFVERQLSFQSVKEQSPEVYDRLETARQRVNNLNSLIEQQEAISRLGAQMESVRSRPGVNAGRMAKMLGPQLYGDIGQIGPVAIKEVLQNSFDAIKTHQLRGLGKGKIDIKTRPETREIEITDNGVGMTPETLGTKFLEIAGTGKEEGASSGGFGIAKMLFLYGNDNLHVISMRDGRVSEMTTKGGELFHALEDPTAAPNIEVRDATPEDHSMFPDGSGTRITMEIPKTFKDPKTGEDLPIDFPNYEWDVPSLNRSPLFADIQVRFNNSAVPIGDAFPMENFQPFSNIDFGWGNARIYVTREAKQGWGDNVHILSNGIFQFSKKMSKEPMNPYSGPIPYEFYIDIAPKVSPEEPGYPFNFNRQSFTERANKDFGKILSYINALYAFDDLAKGAESFGNARYFNETTGQLGAPINLQPTLKVTNSFANTIKAGDEMYVRDGRLYVNGRELPELKESDLKEGLPKAEELKVDPALIDPDSVMVHDNMLVTGANGERVPFYDAMRTEFGGQADKFLYHVGDIFRTLRNQVAEILDYPELKSEAIGVSFDPEYRGVSIRVPFSGSFINPFLPESANIVEAAYGLFGTMIHELAHFKVRNHNEKFPAEMQRIWYKLQANMRDFWGLQNNLLSVMETYTEVFEHGKTLLEGGDAEVAGNRLGGVNEDPTTSGGADGLPEGTDRSGQTGVGPDRLPSGTQPGGDVAQPRHEFGSDAFGPEAEAQLRDQLRIANREYLKAYRALEDEADRLEHAAAAKRSIAQEQSIDLLGPGAISEPLTGPLTRFDFVEAHAGKVDAAEAGLPAKEEAVNDLQVDPETNTVDIGTKAPVPADFKVPFEDGELSVREVLDDLAEDKRLEEAMKGCAI